MNFLILGLPRSRTAWLSNFMNYDGLTCLHEGIDGCSSLSEYADKFTNNVGDANTGLALFNFRKYLPKDIKIVVIDSTIDKSLLFAKNEYSSDQGDFLNTLNERLNKIDGLHVKLEDINERLEDIWSHITDKTFDKGRADRLMKLNIQVMDVHDCDSKAIAELMENNKDDYLA